MSKKLQTTIIFSVLMFAGLLLGGKEALAAPNCSYAGPDGDITYANSGTRTTTAYSVTGTSTIFFPTWSEEGGQNDIVWYGGDPVSGGSNWSANINLASHPGLGNIFVHAYMMNYSNGSWVFCDSANFVRQTPPPPPLPTCTAALPDGDTVIGSTGSRYSYMTGVSGDVTSTILYAWSESGGQDDIVAWPGQYEGGGRWSINIPNASHPANGTIYVHTYMFSANYPGGTYCDSANFTRVAPTPPSVNLQVNGVEGPVNVNFNGSATLSWSTGGSPNVCTINGGGNVGSSGSQSTGALTGDVTYTITCSSDYGSAQDSATVAVNPPTVDLLADGSNGPISIAYGGSATISWTSTSANACNVSGQAGFSGSFSTGALTSNTTYSGECYGDGTPGSDSVTVLVGSPPSPSVIDMRADGSDGPITIAYGGSATISWTSSNSFACNVSGNGGTSGSFSTGALTSNTTYSGQCFGDGAPASDNVTVNVGPPPLPTCSVALPDGDTVIGPDGSRYTYTQGVSGDVTAVKFATWTEYNGQDDIVWYNGEYESSGKWAYNIVLNNHTAVGNIYVHVYMYTAYHTGGTYCDSANFVRLAPELPTVDLRADGSNGPVAVAYGATATISWTTTGAPNQCLLSPEIGEGGNVGASGSRTTGSLTASSYNYSITCSNPYGQGSDTVTVNVNPPASPTCTSATPDGEWTTATSGNRSTVANGVANATAVYFATFTDAQGGGGAIWHVGANQGGGTWSAEVPLASHPGIGNINVHVYMSNTNFSNVFCDSASFSRRGLGTINVSSRDANGNEMPTSWTITCPLTNPTCPTYSSGGNQTTGTYNNAPSSDWTIIPAVIPGYTANVTQGTTQTLPNN